MPNFKVTMRNVQEYVFDITAENEDRALEKATEAYKEADFTGMLHYHEHGDPYTEEGVAFNVTGTDDDFVK